MDWFAHSILIWGKIENTINRKEVDYDFLSTLFFIGSLNEKLYDYQCNAQIKNACFPSFIGRFDKFDDEKPSSESIQSSATNSLI